jgi:hypothetical protein
MSRARYTHDEILSLFAKTDAPPMPCVSPHLISPDPVCPFPTFTPPTNGIMAQIAPHHAAPTFDCVPERSAPPIVVERRSRDGRPASIAKAEIARPEWHSQPPAPEPALPQRLALPPGQFPAAADGEDTAGDADDEWWMPVMPKPLPFALLARRPGGVRSD